MKDNYSVFDCHIIHFPKISNRAGAITPIQNKIDVPFEVKRVYYLYDIPAGESRGAHAHQILEQVIIAASGSFDVTLDDGRNKKTVQLNRPNLGIHVLPGMWRDIYNFSSGAICLVLASELYDSSEYIRDYDSFIKYKNYDGVTFSRF
ncbi:dTDP-6-deoxy-3,4-keto-hexulose isomerase [Adhaeribacter aerolatus]|uniref:dTDP-6-deoxy-3,4-keto-hexulose isomerase n=1 Tax=Adhaeribacter aerolatus TaxID=670289 RepID=A0A512AU67_9BACT|nr:FdtA/QdtA family cupin domain-containing protein [Adhaeribacter aerolatus]GEO03230.1 dTDP-6-deoxy-3,4-keto-hexulose isomerase [Adhaeribacter aerolatus]